jgi:glycosyltransferase involved in cell wall biosynthesis
MPEKVTEALAAGLPVVCTDLLREQLVEGGTDFASVPVLSVGVTDAAGFAAACITLLDGSDEVWTGRQQAGQEFIRKIASLEVFDGKVKEIVDGLR